MNKHLITIIAAGVVVGIAAVILVSFGNPGNMGFCIACFERDIAGALGLHDFQKSAWIRPEILGIIFGALLMALMTREFRPEGGSAPTTRFLLGMFVMIGALAFLGCPLRMVLRLGGGDLNALIALSGFIAGIGGGIYFLKTGFNLGRTHAQPKSESFIMPAFVVGLLLLLVFLPQFKEEGAIFAAAKGYPGSSASPLGIAIGIMVSLGIGLLVGVLAQRSRLCMVGGIRDFILIRSTHLLAGFVAILVVVIIGNIIAGRFYFGFENQPIAHTAHLWNFLGMSLVGLGSILLGGCPFRQLVLTGNGNTDSAISVLGMFFGASIAHNFGLVKAASIYGKGAVILGLIVAILIGFANREK